MLNAKELKEFLEKLEEERNVDLEKLQVYAYYTEEGEYECAEDVHFGGYDITITT